MAPGEALPFQVLDGQGRLLLAAGQRVMDVRQLQALLERGACVRYVDAQSVRAARAAGRQAGSLAPSARRRTLFDAWEQQIWALDALLRQVGRHTSLEPLIRQFADELTQLIDHHPDAALFLCMRQDDRRFALYGLTHGLYTACVALFAARQLAWPVAQQTTLMCAALTMNVSLLELQARMAEQTDPPSKRQLEEIRGHTSRSVESLRLSGVSDESWLQTVAEHHEQPGGGGYPAGLSEVCEMARLLRASDVFMAKISPRALRAPLQPQVAARELFRAENGGPLAAALIKSLGVYPPGDFVRLKGGELAIVVQRLPAGTAPRVMQLLDAAGKPARGMPRRDTSQPEWAIAGPATSQGLNLRILPEQVYGLVEF